MELGTIGLGRMGTNMVRRLLRAGHQCVVYDLQPEAVQALVKIEYGILTAIDESVPAPVLSAALFARFSSRGEGDFADQVLSALRYQFGGHEEKAAVQKGDV